MRQLVQYRVTGRGKELMFARADIWIAAVLSLTTPTRDPNPNLKESLST